MLLHEPELPRGELGRLQQDRVGDSEFSCPAAARRGGSARRCPPIGRAGARIEDAVRARHSVCRWVPSSRYSAARGSRCSVSIRAIERLGRAADRRRHRRWTSRLPGDLPGTQAIGATCAPGAHADSESAVAARLLENSSQARMIAGQMFPHDRVSLPAIDAGARPLDDILERAGHSIQASWRPSRSSTMTHWWTERWSWSCARKAYYPRLKRGSRRSPHDSR